MSISRLFLPTLLLAIAIPSCGSTSEAPTDSSSPTEALFCEQYAARICALHSPCCAQIDSPLDESACLAVAKSECEAIPSYAREHGLTYDESAAADCLQRIDDGIASCLVTNEIAHKLGRDACRRDVYRGSIPLGGACSRDEDCARHPDGRTACGPTPGGKLICVLPTASKQGGPCIEHDEKFRSFFCEEGLTCSPSHECVPPLPAGATCANGSERSACAAPNLCLDGVCEAPRDEGASCSAPSDCASSRCTDEICQARTGLGDACDPGEWPNGGCSEGFCDEPSLVCKALLQDGAACADALNCESQRCEGGQCVPASFIETKVCGAASGDKMPTPAP